MSYSSDLRKRVLDFVHNGGSKAEASRIYNVSRACIYNLLAAEDPLSCKKPGPRRIDYDALKQHVADFPDHTLMERATHFGVSTNCIWYAFGKLNITRKKKTLTCKEQCPEKRQVYLDAFDLEVQVGGKTPVYVDESDFPTSQLRRYAYAPKGVCVQDKISGSYRYQSTTLIAAPIGDSFTVLVLFEGASDALAFNAWSEQQLCPLLDETHVVIMDNASFHKGSETARLIAKTGVSLLFLPPYAPELNPIEKNFANIKRQYQYNPETSIDQIIKRDVHK